MTTGRHHRELDYYRLDGPGGLLVEEFCHAADHTTTGLRSTTWSPADPRWRGAVELSRRVRGGARAVAVSRAAAATAYRRFGGGDLPDEATLRGYADHLPLPTAAPLVLTAAAVPAGFAATRTYRILVAGDLDAARLAGLRDGWRLAPDDGPGVVGVARRAVDRDAFAWRPRRIGAGTAWCVDVTVQLGGPDDTTVGPLLWELTTVLRRHGVVPVATERFA